MIFSLFLFPFVGNAEEKVVNICKEGCEYDRLLPAVVDINFLEEDYDVIVNFKDAGPYYFIEDERDYLLADNTESYVCEQLLGGEYDLGDCYRDGVSIRDREFFNALYFVNKNLSSITVNGVEEKTTIRMTPLLSASEFLMAFSFPGVLMTNFTFNNLNFESSLYFASGGEKIEGTVNNCDVKYSLLAYGNVKLSIENSKILNVISIGEEINTDEIAFPQASVGNPKIIMKNNSNTYAEKGMGKISEDDLVGFNLSVKEYKDTHPYPVCEVNILDYPRREPNESLADYNERLKEFHRKIEEYENAVKEWDDAYLEFFLPILEERFHKDYLHLAENNPNDFFPLFINTSEGSFENFRRKYEEYAAQNPPPQRLPYPQKNKFATEEEYQAALDAYNESSNERYKWSLALLDDAYDYTTGMLADSGDALIKLFSMIVFGDAGDYSNLVEIGGGRIVFSDYKATESPISKHLTLREIAEEWETTLDGWELSENGIIEIRNGEIIPLKVGEVVMTKTEGDKEYTLKVVISPDMLNPNTKRNISFILLLIGLGLGTYYTTKKRRV